MARLLSLPLRAPRTTLLVLLAITAVLGVFASRVYIDSSFENLLAAHDPERIYYEQVQREFGSDQATQIGLFADDVFAPEKLAVIDRLTRRLEKVAGVREVLSLTNVKGVEATDFGVRVGRMMRELPTTPAEAETFRKAVLDSPLYIGNFVSEDSRATTVLVFFEPMEAERFQQLGITDNVHDAVVEARKEMEVAISGIQTVKAEIAVLMKQDLLRFLPLSIFLIAFILAWQFRTVRGVLLPLGSVLIALLWTLGIIALSGRAINMGTLILPPLLLAIGITYTIHLVSGYYHELHLGRPRAEVVRATMERNRVPLAVAALTTALGFASLVISPITATRELGVFAVLGTLAVLILDLTFIPAALMVLPNIRALPQPGELRHSRVAARIQRLTRFAIRERWKVITVTVLICLACLAGARHLRVNTDYVEFFAEDSDVRRDHNRFAAVLGSNHPIYFVVEGPGPNTVATIENVAAIQEIQDFVANQPGVGSTLSVADFVALAQKALIGDEGPPMPETQAELNQLLLLLSPEDLEPVLNRDQSRSALIVKTTISASNDLRAFIQRVEDFARDRFPGSVTIHSTGIVVLLNRSADALSYGQVASLVQLLVVLLLLMSMLFLSLRAGALSLVPNVVPVVVLFGVMGWTGIPLDFSTSMIAVIAIGIAVDATVHYLTTFNDELHATGSQEAAIANVARKVGRPIVFTAGALTAGFLTICLSNFKPIQSFGLLTGFTLLVALAAHLLLMPALAMTTRIITLWDLLYVKLGPKPQEEIPLFAGLRAFQARIVVLMAHLATAGPGAYLTRRGEMTPELYVLISGCVHIHRREGEGVLRTLGRGEVVGEMGLIRDRPRSVDTIAVEQTEYLVLDRAFLDRIRRRYPRIAAKLFFNLTRTLSDRLESTTGMLARGTLGE